jgi:predicted RND superfamily exporter protein
MSQHAPPGLQWEIAGYSRLFADMEELVVTGQVYSLWGALGLIFLLMLILWRSIGSALICMIPNISPVLLIFIIMGLFGIWLDMATAMIASVAVGIAVDDTIHVYHGYLHRIKKGIPPVHALVRTFSQAGRAVVTTTIILTAQFMILVTSLFQPTTHFGLLTSIGLWAALIFDLILLPSLLVFLASRKLA